jgi:large subunit ribosomal protein L18
MLTKKEQRLRRARQTRIRIAQQGVARLTVNRTNLHIYASVVSGDGSKVLASASTTEADVPMQPKLLASASLKKRKLLV